MTLRIVGIRFGIKTEFDGKLYDGRTKSYGGGGVLRKETENDHDNNNIFK